MGRQPDSVPARAAMKGAPPSDLELLNDERARRNFQETVVECARGGIDGPIEGFALELRDWGFRLNDIKTHVSIWQGAADNVVFPTAASYMASKLPNRRLHVIPEAGHLTVIVRHEAPAHTPQIGATAYDFGQNVERP